MEKKLKDNINSLKKLLEIKEGEEKEASRNLAQKVGAEQKLLQELESLQAKIEELEEILAEEREREFKKILSSGFCVKSLEIFYNYEKGIKLKLKELISSKEKLNKKLEIAKSETEKAREELFKKTNEKKVVEKLIEKKRLEILKEIERREELEGEEYVNTKFSYKK